MRASAKHSCTYPRHLLTCPHTRRIQQHTHTYLEVWEHRPDEFAKAGLVDRVDGDPRAMLDVVVVQRLAPERNILTRVKVVMQPDDGGR